jgi:ribonuclease D
VSNTRSSVVTTDEELSKIVDAARDSGRFGLDTEFLRERTYRARLCLVQVATGDVIALIDPLAAVDLAPLAELVGESSIEVVVHAGRQDLDILYDLFGVTPCNVFDVQLAAGFAGYGSSLPYGRLVEATTGTALTKGESYTDWCRRPLTAAQLSYAADDVRFLLPVADRLADRVEHQGRTEWVAEEMAHFEDPQSYGVRPEDAWRRVSGRGTLSGRQTAVLRELAGWRERAAARRDLPRNWIIKDPSLIEIARRQPESISALKSIRGVNAKEAERSGRGLLDAIELGRRAPVSNGAGPVWPRDVVARARMTLGLADAVARARCERAGIAIELVVTRPEMESVLSEVFARRLEESRHRLLQGWRRELVGETVLALARGELALRTTNVPPYIEEVVVDGRG